MAWKLINFFSFFTSHARKNDTYTERVDVEDERGRRWTLVRRNQDNNDIIAAQGNNMGYVSSSRDNDAGWLDD